MTTADIQAAANLETQALAAKYLAARTIREALDLAADTIGKLTDAGLATDFADLCTEEAILEIVNA